MTEMGFQLQGCQVKKCQLQGCQVAVFFCMAFVPSSSEIRNLHSLVAPMKSMLLRMVVITACAQITRKKSDISASVLEFLSFSDWNRICLLSRVLCARCVIGVLKIRGYTERVDELERSLFRKFIAVEGRRIGG